MILLRIEVFYTAIYDSIERITPEQRDVILLRFLENLSYDEIASVIDRSGLYLSDKVL
jgi:DNA-directed RNA polymerase specialized sigma24 family protein